MTSNSDFRSFSARLREFIRVSAAHSLSGLMSGEGGGEFQDLAAELFALQYAHNEPYRAFCRAKGVSPASIRAWTEIPAVPAAGFKELDLSCLPAGLRTTVFHSSGTTGQRPSRHYHSTESLAAYEASLLPWFAAHLGVSIPTGAAAHSDPQHRLALLSPPPAQAPHSSLVYMFETIRRHGPWASVAFLAEAGSDGSWIINTEMAREFLAPALGHDEPVVVLGPAFSFVHLLDDLARRGLTLQCAPGSRAMETGGYKGRSRSVSKADLHGEIRTRLGIRLDHIVTEYGMSELSSQAYDRTVPPVHGIGGEPFSGPPLNRGLAFPPWARAVVVSPETGLEVRAGETGLLRIYDLANVWSVMAIQTEDLARSRAGGFELLGRSHRVEPRGCSLLPA